MELVYDVAGTRGLNQDNQDIIRDLIADSKGFIHVRDKKTSVNVISLIKSILYILTLFWEITNTIYIIFSQMQLNLMYLFLGTPGTGQPSGGQKKAHNQMKAALNWT